MGVALLEADALALLPAAGEEARRPNVAEEPTLAARDCCSTRWPWSAEGSVGSCIEPPRLSLTCRVGARWLGLLIGYARVSTDVQDLTAQRNALTTLGAPTD